MRAFLVAILASALAVAYCYDEAFDGEATFAGIPLSRLPDPDNRPAMSRFIVNNANWTSYGYISKRCKSSCGCPGNAVFATSDGPLGCGSGIPYFWASRNHPTIVELLDDDPSGAIVMTLAQTDICRENKWDPQDPRCAHVTLFGNFVKLSESDAEYNAAKNALFSRHPQFSYYPPGHKFFFAKFNITTINIISKFGGPVEVNLQEYYKVKC